MSIASSVPREVWEVIIKQDLKTPESLYGRLAWLDYGESGEEYWARLSPEEQMVVIRRVVLHWWMGGAEEWGQIFLKSLGEEWV